MILTGVSINQPSYEPQNYQIFLLTTLLMIIHGVVSSMPTKWIAQFNSYGSTFNIIALGIVIVLIPAGTNREEQGHPRFTPAREVWGDFYAGTDFSPGVSMLMTFVAVIWTMRYALFPPTFPLTFPLPPPTFATTPSPPSLTPFLSISSGYDAPFHLSEESSNANIAAPRAIVLTSGIGGLFGWFLQLVVAYTVIDVGKILDADSAWATYLLQVLPKKAALAALALTVVAGFSMGQGCMVSLFLPLNYRYSSRPWKRVVAHGLG